MWALYKFQMRSYWKNPSAIMGFLSSLLLLLIFASIYPDSFTSSVGNVLTLTYVTSSLFAFGFAIFELKESVILKRIGSTSVTKTSAMAAFFLTYTTIMVILSAWIFGVVAIFDATGFATFDWAIINWGVVVYGAMLAIMVSLTFGWFLVSISKTVTIFNMFVSIYFFLVTFLGGLFFPQIGLDASTEWLTYVGYAIPHTYSAHFMSHAFQGADVFNIVEGYTYPNPLDPNGLPIVVANWEASLNVFVPIASSAVFFGIGAKAFKWEN